MSVSSTSQWSSSLTRVTSSTRSSTRSLSYQANSCTTTRATSTRTKRRRLSRTSRRQGSASRSWQKWHTCRSSSTGGVQTRKDPLRRSPEPRPSQRSRKTWSRRSSRGQQLCSSSQPLTRSSHRSCFSMRSRLDGRRKLS